MPAPAVAPALPVACVANVTCVPEAEVALFRLIRHLAVPMLACTTQRGSGAAPKWVAPPVSPTSFTVTCCLGLGVRFRVDVGFPFVSSSVMPWPWPWPWSAMAMAMALSLSSAAEGACFAGGTGVTAAVAADVLPPASPVTSTEISSPTSSLVSVSIEDVAPGISWLPSARAVGSSKCRQ
ncbi:MAG TPA: hypothetical protein VHV75_18930 [Solirubrobacteraceae bacterium]|jgi:hypothetical protein|nr:hypothetical protein [Solirubrobacteraceae bacterium]